MKIIAIINYINYFTRKLRDDFVGAFSAQAAFFTIISFFPFVMFLLTMLQYLPITESTLLSMASKVVPQGVNSFVVSVISEIYDKASGTLISVTAITALWSASRGFLAIVRGLNSVYGIKETRNYFKLRFISAIYTLAFAVMLIITMALLVFGNSLYLWIEQKIPVLNDLALLLISIRTTAVLAILVLFFVIIYYAIPNRRTRFFKEIPGAVLTAAGWMGFSYLYSFYFEVMGNFSYMYGSLAAIVLLMLWLYACMYIMFIGAEVNVLLQEHNWRTLFKKLREKPSHHS